MGLPYGCPCFIWRLDGSEVQLASKRLVRFFLPPSSRSTKMNPNGHFASRHRNLNGEWFNGGVAATARGLGRSCWASKLKCLQLRGNHAAASAIRN